jgi:thymidine kinase
MPVEVVCGPMFSGKSTYICSLVNRYLSVGMDVLVLKPSNDNRYSDTSEVITHNNLRCQCWTPGSHLMEIPFNVLDGKDVIIIDESQFFDDLRVFVESQETKHVVVVGLDGDYLRKPFGQVLDCIPLADKVTKLTAMCEKCADGTPALFSYRKVLDKNQVSIGGSNKYSAFCRSCYLMFK